MAELRDKVRDIPGFKAYVENFEPISVGEGVELLSSLMSKVQR